MFVLDTLCISLYEMHIISCLINHVDWSCDNFEGSFRYPLAREGVYASGGHVCLAHFMQKFSNIVDLTVLRLAFFMGYGSNKVVQ